jgi:hypothetical protein
MSNDTKIQVLGVVVGLVRLSAQARATSGVGGLAAGHDGKAATLDEAAAIPRADLAELSDLDRSVALRAEAVGTDRGKRRYGGVVGGNGCLLVGAAAGDPAAPAEADDGGGDGADGRRPGSKA